MLRPFRAAFTQLFLDMKISDLSKGRHHWTEEKWFDRLGEFLTKVLKIKNLTKKDLAAAILLQYPAFGPSTGKKDAIKKVNEYKSKLIYKLLGDHGINLYKS